MRPKKARRPFTLFQRETKGGIFWYVRFWDEAVRKYAITRSTGVPVEGKKKRRYEAEEAAREMLPQIKFTPATVEKSFIQYLRDFWTPNSPYVKEAALVKKRPLSAYYISMNHDDALLHIASFPAFQGITLQKLTPALIRDWLIWMAEKKLSGARIDNVLQGQQFYIYPSGSSS